MKVLLLVDVYSPVAQAAAVLMHDLGKEIVSRGHDVTVLTPVPDQKEPIMAEKIDNIQVVRVQTPDFKGVARGSGNALQRKLAHIKRGIREAQISRAIRRNAGDFLRKNPQDLIVYYSPSIFFGPLVKKLKALWRVPSYLILRDIFPQWLVDAGELSRFHPGLLFLRYMEELNYKVADTIAVQSPGNLEYFREKGWNTDRNFEVLYNWTDKNRRQEPSSKYRKQFGYKKDDVVFFFGGTFTEAQDMDNLLRLAKNLEDVKTAKFLFVGKGPYYDQLEENIKSGGHKNVTLHPAVDHATFLEIMADIDIGLITLDKRLKTHNVPGKLLDYIVFGKPVVASLNPGNDLREILNASGAGFAFDNGDDEGLTAASRVLAMDRKGREEAGKAALSLQEELFSVQRAADQVLGRSERMLKRVMKAA